MTNTYQSLCAVIYRTD